MREGRGEYLKSENGSHRGGHDDAREEAIVPSNLLHRGEESCKGTSQSEESGDRREGSG